MIAPFRSWKFCETVRCRLDGVDGWHKRRLWHSRFMIPPGNIGLRMLGSGCEMTGKEWPRHEMAMFHLAHPDLHEPRVMASGIWLPHIAGSGLREVSDPGADLAAFTELARFHRLGDSMIHGDPHAGNFLHDAVGHQTRIIDFETRPPRYLSAGESRARDFLILALDLVHHGRNPAFFPHWRDAYGNTGPFCPVDPLLKSTGIALTTYWKLLGYRVPPDFLS